VAVSFIGGGATWGKKQEKYRNDNLYVEYNKIIT
jgi:hypothetical protein